MHLHERRTLPWSLASENGRDVCLDCSDNFLENIFLFLSYSADLEYGAYICHQIGCAFACREFGANQTVLAHRLALFYVFLHSRLNR